jgi:hypothetical protein
MQHVANFGLQLWRDATDQVGFGVGDASRSRCWGRVRCRTRCWVWRRVWCWRWCRRCQDWIATGVQRRGFPENAKNNSKNGSKCSRMRTHSGGIALNTEESCMRTSITLDCMRQQCDDKTQARRQRREKPNVPWVSMTPESAQGSFHPHGHVDGHAPRSWLPAEHAEHERKPMECGQTQPHSLRVGFTKHCGAERGKSGIK